jgi:hypothetical protein
MNAQILQLPKTSSVPSLESSAMLVELSISLWTARKLDKKVSQDIDISNSTMTKAGNYHKNLLAGDDSLPTIQKLITRIRNYHMLATSPWSDNGTRLLTTSVFLEYQKQMAQFEKEYWDAVNDFLPIYNTKISAAAFQLGALFNREEYPDVDRVKDKFGFRLNYTPLPSAGDFRVDIGHQGLEELRYRYESVYTQNIEKVMEDAWNRLHGILTQLSYGLRTNEDGTKGKVYTSVLENAEQLCSLLRFFNIKGDAQLEAMRVTLENALIGIEVKDFTQSDFLRKSVKDTVDTLLDKWG